LIAAFERAADARAEAAGARERAAKDRVKAATDRQQAAEDRVRTDKELQRAHLDDLTGAYGRSMGENALRAEIERAQYSGLSLVLVYVDVDGLKGTNDREGHAAGDAMLRDVAAAIRANLRTYEPIVRFGGDEFVCTLSSTDLAGARERFDEVEQSLSSASISVGFADLRPNESLEELLARGDAALYEAKRGA
jgi:diguanylate cyclase (GGDEF)-like protein